VARLLLIHCLVIHSLVSSLERPTDGMAKWLVDLPTMILYGLRPVYETCVYISAQRHVTQFKHRPTRTSGHSVLCLGNVTW
jgi:hypothetical protein